MGIAHFKALQNQTQLLMAGMKFEEKIVNTEDCGGVTSCSALGWLPWNCRYLV